MTNDTSRRYAEILDERDGLAHYRTRFLIPDENMIYLDGNSLGRQSIDSAERMRGISNEWANDLIGGYNKNWWLAPGRVGDKIGTLVGAQSGQVIVCDTVSLNLFKLASAALELNQGRKKIITDTLNFPTDLYILQGLVRSKGDRNRIVRIGSRDGDVTPDLEALEAEIDSSTALVTLSQVTFKSGYLYDMKTITELAHRHGALVLWDLSHSVGALPIGLDDCCVDFAIGCTYKYLNGGPGSPAFLYVRRSIQERVVSPIWGWWGQKNPFGFDLDYSPAQGITRFLSGSQPIISLLAMEAGLAPMLEAGMNSLREKSIQLSEYLIQLAEAFLIPLGFSLGSPQKPENRGSHISLRHPDGYRINRALIEDLNVVPDFREPDNIRLGLTPLYTTFKDVWDGVDRIRRAVTEKYYEKYTDNRLTVT